MTAAERVHGSMAARCRAMYAVLAGLVLYDGMPAPVSQILDPNLRVGWLTFAAGEDLDAWARYTGAVHDLDHIRGWLDGWQLRLRLPRP